MNKNFKYYVAIWIIMFVIFNVIVFIVTGNTIGLDSVGSSYWIAYAFIICSFFAQLVCAKLAFGGDLKKLFYGIPLIQVSSTGLIAMTVSGTVIMVINRIPSWIGAVICIIITGFNAISVVKAKAISDIVSSRDEDIRKKTEFIREMTSEAEILYKNAATPEEKRELKKLYEAFRFANPLSAPSVDGIEAIIRNEMDDIKSYYSKTITDEIKKRLVQRDSKLKEGYVK